MKSILWERGGEKTHETGEVSADDKERGEEPDLSD